MGLCSRAHARSDASAAREPSTKEILGGDQPSAGAVRQARVHRAPSQMFGLSGSGVLPASWSDGASLKAGGGRREGESNQLLSASATRVSASPDKRNVDHSSRCLAPICL